MNHLVMKAQCNYISNVQLDSKWKQVCLDGPGEIGTVGKKCLCSPYQDKRYCPCLDLEKAKSTIIIEDGEGIIIDSVNYEKQYGNEKRWILEQANYIEKLSKKNNNGM